MKNYIKHNPYIFIIFIFSVLLFLLTGTIIIFMLLNTYENDARSVVVLVTLYSLICIIAIFVFNILFIYIKNKWQKGKVLVNIFSVILNIIILGQQLFILIFAMLFSYIETHPNWDDEYKPITNPANYIEAKHKIGDRKETKHFPDNIPDNAKSIRLYEYYWTFKDYSAILLLKFDIENSYIENEIQKNKCRKLITPSIDNSEYKEIEPKLNEIRDNKYYEPSNYTFCVLNSDNSSKVGYISTYGIAFNRNQIVYYFSKTNW